MTLIELLKRENIFTEGKSIVIRNLTEKDRLNYLHTLKGVSFIPQIFETKGFQDIVWQDVITSVSSITFAVERKHDSAYVGDCMMKVLTNDSFEVGVDVSPEYQNQGIGTEVMILVIAEIRKRFADKRIISRVYSDNDKSQHIIRLLGGIKIGEELSEYSAAVAILNQLDEGIEQKAHSILELLKEKHIDVYEFR